MIALPRPEYASFRMPLHSLRLVDAWETEQGERGCIYSRLICQVGPGFLGQTLDHA